MAKTYSDLWAKAAELEKEGSSVSKFQESVAKLPFELKDAFRKKQDPELDKAINKAQADTYSAPFKALEKYQNIENPFTRRALAEEYAGTFQQGWQNLLDEKTRREGVYSDYIDKWTGLFGAEAARRQNEFENKKSMWSMEKSLVDAEESKKKGSAGDDKKLFYQYAQNELANSVGEDGKYDPRVYDRIRNEAKKYGIDKSSFDSEYSYGLGEHEYKGLGITTKELSPTQQIAEMKLEDMQRERGGTGSIDDPYGDESKAKGGEYYWAGTKKKKKVNWWFDETID